MPAPHPALQLVETGLQEQGKPLDRDDQQFLAECRRRQDEAVAAGLCSPGYAV